MAKSTKKTPVTQAASKDDARASGLQAFLSLMEKDRPGEVRALSDDSVVDVEVFPTGAISLDVALGTGGLPKGRIIEIYGNTGSGKTTLALATAVNCQKRGGVVGFVDCEHALSRDLALDMGINGDNFVVYQPKDGEDTIDMVEQMLRSRAFDMIVVDSIAAMTPRAEMEAEVQQVGMAHHARLMSKFMRRITGLVAETETMLLCLNQVRKALGSYVVMDTPTGGQAIPFYSSVRIQVNTSNSKRIEKNGEFIGTTVTATVVKNKLASPFKKAEYDVIFGKGIAAGGSLLAVCEDLGLVVRSGATYTDAVTGERLGIGKDNVKKLIEDDPALAARLTSAVYATIEEHKRPAVVTPDEDAGSDGYEDTTEEE
jgi:recombination protein RecA